MSSKDLSGTTLHALTTGGTAAVAAGCVLVIAVSLSAGPAQAKRPDLDGRAAPTAQSGWAGEQEMVEGNLAERHAEMTAGWRLGLGG
jgi:hypothetical protein